MHAKANRYLKIYPLFMGLTSDLLFYIAINTLFFSINKGFSAAQIVSMSSFSQVVCIVLQFPILFVIKKIGNTASVRTSAIMLLLGAVFITFGETYTLVLIGRIFHNVSFVFHSASTVALENNLELLDKRGDFVRIRTAGTTAYAVITMLVSFVASFMYNLDNYLPMYACIATCALGVVLSFFMKDCSSYDKIVAAPKKKEKTKIPIEKFIVLAVLTYALFYPIVDHVQGEGKLFIQDEVMLSFDVEQTALIIGAILCASRVIRVFSNVVFARLYEKYRGKVGVALPVLLSLSIAFLLFGSLIGGVLFKILVMGLGYTVILFVRDPFKLYIQDVLFENTPKEQHQTLLTVLAFGVKVGGAGLGLVFSALLLEYPMILIVAIMLVIAVCEIFLALWLYRLVGSRGKKSNVPAA